MNLTVLTDEAGKILFIQESTTIAPSDSIANFTGEANIIPAARQLLNQIEIPLEIQNISLPELMMKFRVNLTASIPFLQSIESQDS